MAAKSEDNGAYVKVEEGSVQPREEQHQKELRQSGFESLEAAQGNPWVIWPVFTFSIFVGGTSGPVMVSMENANPVALVGWRHQISSVVMLPCFIYEAMKMDESQRRKLLSPATLLVHFFTGLTLAAHYAIYSMALQTTSMPHCLFIINTSPIYVALFMKLSGGVLYSLELGGICLSLLGIAIFAIGNALGSSDHSTHYGDFLAFLGSILTAGYLIVAKSLRSWMPVFIYQFPVAVYSMIILCIGGWVSKDWFGSDGGADALSISGPFDWISKEFWWQTLYLGAACGVLAQGGYSYVLKYSSPLALPTAFAFQPIVGSVLSWIVGQTPVPGVWTWIGGVAILTGTTVVNVAPALRKTQSATSNVERPSTDNHEQSRKPLLNDHS